MTLPNGKSGLINVMDVALYELQRLEFVCYQQSIVIREMDGHCRDAICKMANADEHSREDEAVKEAMGSILKAERAAGRILKP